MVAALPAVAALDPGHLADLVERGRYREAYDLAGRYRAGHEGEVRFDFHYGLAAIGVGELSEGIFALERVLLRDPGFDRARLELARACYLQGNDRRARRNFEAVLARDPPASVRASIERYLLAIERRADRYETVASGHLELGVGYDTNVNSATSSDAVDTIIGEVRLADGGTARADAFTRIAVGGDVSHPLAPGLNLVASANVETFLHPDESDFDTGSVAARTGLMKRTGRWRLTGSVDAQRFYVDGDAYRDLAGIGTTYRRSLDERTVLDASARVVRLRYPDREVLDSTLWLVGGGLTRGWKTGLRPSLSGGVFVGGEQAKAHSDAAKAVAERDIAGASAGLHLRVAPQWVLRNDLEYRASDYAAESVLFGRNRREQYYRLRVGVDWLPTARWRVGPEVRYTRNDANIGLYEYQRTEFEVRARYDFH